MICAGHGHALAVNTSIYHRYTKCDGVDEIRWLGKDPVGVSRTKDNEPSGSPNILTDSAISASDEELIQ